MEFMNAEELAELLVVDKRSIYAQTRAGQIPHVKVGRQYRYSRQGIERWVREQEDASCNQPVSVT